MSAKQYCRYCAWCIDGDAFYCTDHDVVLSETQIKRPNKCKDFALSELGDIETGKPYHPRVPKEKPKPLDCELLFEMPKE